MNKDVMVDLTEAERDRHNKLFNYKSLIAERRITLPDDNENFNFEETFKKIVKQKAEKTH